jgi:uncharacterized protein
VHPVVAATPAPAIDGLAPTGLRSCLYEGTTGHRRRIDVGHGFSQPIVLAYLDLAELDDVFAAHPLWSTRRAAPVRFRRSDMHGDPSTPLDAAVRATLAAGLGVAPAGPIRVLTHLRHWAWTFNPISLYFAFDEADTRVEAVLAEVTNTPWHERHAYALAAPPPAVAENTGIRFAKQLHVSPFMDLDLDHVLRFSPPGHDRLTVDMDDERQDATSEVVFQARMVLRQRPLDRASMADVLRHHRLPAHRVSAGIHLNALRLWRKGAPFRRHPKHHRSTAA